MIINNPLSSFKIFNHIDKLYEWKYNGITGPIMLDFHLTNKCNHSCPECNGVKENQVEFSKEDAISVIKQFYEIGIKSIILSGGGEPFLSKCIFNVINLCNELNISIGIITNGSLLDENNLSKLINKCEWIRISLDAGSKERYKLVHGESANWEKLLNNLENISKHQNRKTVIGVSYLTNGQEKDDMIKAFYIAKNNKLDYIEYKPFRNSTTNLFGFLVSLQEIFSDSKTKILIPDGEYDRINLKRSYKICHAKHFIAVVTADGNVHRCCEQYIKRNFKPIGNVLEQSVKDIWFSDIRKNTFDENVTECPIDCRNNQLNNNIQKYLIDIETSNNFI